MDDIAAFKSTSHLVCSRRPQGSQSVIVPDSIARARRLGEWITERFKIKRNDRCFSSMSEHNIIEGPFGLPYCNLGG